MCLDTFLQNCQFIFQIKFHFQILSFHILYIKFLNSCSMIGFRVNRQKKNKGWLWHIVCWKHRNNWRVFIWIYTKSPLYFLTRRSRESRRFGFSYRETAWGSPLCRYNRANDRETRSLFSEMSHYCVSFS